MEPKKENKKENPVLGAKKDYSTAILERKKAPNRLMVNIYSFFILSVWWFN